MYYVDRQDFAYQRGAYDYLHSIAMVPRMATIASYIKAFGITRVLDVGCGTGDLLSYLDSDVSYIGIDISQTAINIARRRFVDRKNAFFDTADFRHWKDPLTELDGVVWAGISCTWTRKGRGGSSQDWLDILALAEQPLKAGGYIILELVTTHWPSLERIIEGRYEYETGCDINCFQSEESPKRAVRVFRKKHDRTDLSSYQHSENSVISNSIVQQLIEYAKGMGQMTDEGTNNLGYGYLYYGLTRIHKPEVVVCIGSYRGFAPICLALGLVDNQKGICYFIDPGKVDEYWHDPKNVAQIERTFALHDCWQHLCKSSQQVVAEGCLRDSIDILLIDGDHSYEGVKFDFDHFGHQVRTGGLILFHDSINEGKGFTEWEVKRFLESEVYSKPSQYETFTFPFSAGLTLVKKLS